MNIFDWQAIIVIIDALKDMRGVLDKAQLDEGTRLLSIYKSRPLKQSQKEYFNYSNNLQTIVDAHQQEFDSIGDEITGSFANFVTSANALGNFDELGVFIVSHPILAPIAKTYFPIREMDRGITIAPSLIDKNDQTRRLFEELISYPDVHIVFDEREHQGLWNVTWGNKPEDTVIRLSFANDAVMAHEVIKTMNDNFLYSTNLGYEEYLMLPDDTFEAPNLREQSMVFPNRPTARIEYDECNVPFAELYDRAHWLPSIVASYMQMSDDTRDMELTLDNFREIHEKLGIKDGIGAYRSGVPLEDICA